MVTAIVKKSTRHLFSTVGVFLWIGLAGSMILAGVSQAATGKVTTRVEMDRGTLPADQVQTAVVKVTLDAPAPVERARRPERRQPCRADRRLLHVLGPGPRVVLEDQPGLVVVAAGQQELGDVHVAHDDASRGWPSAVR